MSRLTDDLPRAGARVMGVSGPGEESQGGTARALDALSKFLPTEILAPYVAFLAFAAGTQRPSPASVYWGFVVATPLVTALFLFAKAESINGPGPYPSPPYGEVSPQRSGSRSGG